MDEISYSTNVLAILYVDSIWNFNTNKSGMARSRMCFYLLRTFYPSLPISVLSNFTFSNVRQNSDEFTYRNGILTSLPFLSWANKFPASSFVERECNRAHLFSKYFGEHTCRIIKCFTCSTWSITGVNLHITGSISKSDRNDDANEKVVETVSIRLVSFKWKQYAQKILYR